MIKELQKLLLYVKGDSSLKDIVRGEIESEVEYGHGKYSLLSFTIGTQEPDRPVIFITGGFHGLERIGVQLAWSLLKTTIERLAWDKSLNELIKNVRIVFLPLINPVGYNFNTRSNGNAVDLMRNSPVNSISKPPYLLGGHRLSKLLPWYQGAEGVLELENQMLEKVFKREAMTSPCVVSLDFHSGFGLKDRLWFPYSHSLEPFDDLAEMHAFVDLFEQTHPYHIYRIEPQSRAYLLNGDMWDYLYLKYREQNTTGTFLPFTLEMGSWNWVKKNPTQIFTRHGAFNPVKEHRVKRTYRRHNLLFDFILKAVNSHEVWSELDPRLNSKHEQLALKRWY
jgi:hypothetical protein